VPSTPAGIASGHVLQWEGLRLARATHQLPHLVYGNAARQLDHARISELGADRVLRPVSKAGQGRAVGPNRPDDR